MLEYEDDKENSPSKKGKGKMLWKKVKYELSEYHSLPAFMKDYEYIFIVMLRLDYAGIAALISTSFNPPVYYSFMCTPFFCNLHLSAITLLGIATVIFSLLPSLFFGMGFSGVVPILHKLILYRHQPEALQTTGYEILTGILIPEMWKPGKFDIAGHSHQLFHVLVAAGAYTDYHAGLITSNAEIQ